MSVLKIKREDGTWEAIGGGNSAGSGESELFIVTVDATTMTASHSASEIYAAASQGKFVVATIEEEDGYLMYFLPNDIPNYGAGFSRTVNVGGDYVDVLALSINEDKTVTTTLHTLPNVPEFDRTEDAGKVLTITANGLKWMTSIGGGDVPPAEGVEF